MKNKFLVVGCFSLIALFSIFIIAAYYFLNQTSIELVEQYTSPVPLDFQSTSTDKAAAQETLERFKHFMTVVGKGETIESFSLSEEDINNLLLHADWFRRLRGMAHVTIQKDLLLAEISVPLGIFNDRFHGRYLNGKAELEIGVVDDRLRVSIDRLEVDGRSLPREFMTEIRNSNVVAALYEEPTLKTFFNFIAAVKIEDGWLVLQSKE